MTGTHPRLPARISITHTRICSSQQQSGGQPSCRVWGWLLSFQQVTESCWRTACPTSSSPPLALSSSIHPLEICPDKLSHAGSCCRQPPPISALHSCLVHRSAQHSFGEACSLRSVEIKPRRWQWPSPFSAGASGGIEIRENHRWWLAEVVLQCRGSPTESPLGTEANKDVLNTFYPSLSRSLFPLIPYCVCQVGVSSWWRCHPQIDPEIWSCC